MESLQSPFQVREGDAFINNETFDLMEHRRVCWIECIASKHAPGADDAHRGLNFFHRPHLNGGSLASQADVLGHVAGVAEMSCPMTGREIRRGDMVGGA